MSRDLFVPTLVGWFQDRADDVIRSIADASGISGPAPTDMFRPPQVDDATTRRHNAPAAAERLIRWDLRGPEEVFWTGFPPLVFPSAGQYPRDAFNLRDYVAHNIPSIFVGTARFYRNARGSLTRWQRRVTTATAHRFEYEIYAYGGIDVNHVLGDNHQYANQHEIAFPGGIRPELIQSAREFMDNTIIRVWENTHFNNTVNAPHTPPLAMLPAPRRPPPGVPVVPYPPPEQRDPPPNLPGHDELRRRREAGEADLMYGDGETLDDAMFDVSPVPRSSVACVLTPTDKGRAYFFCGPRYAAIDIHPGTTDDSIAWGPKSLVFEWPSLGKAGFTGGVDAVLPNPRNSDEMYFFCMEQYALIKVKPGTFSSRCLWKRGTQGADQVRVSMCYRDEGRLRCRRAKEYRQRVAFSEKGRVQDH